MLSGVSRPDVCRPRLLMCAAWILTLGLSTAGAQQNAAAAREDRFAIPPTNDGLPGAGPIRRYDWFQKVWRERRSLWAREVERDRLEGAGEREPVADALQPA